MLQLLRRGPHGADKGFPKRFRVKWHPDRFSMDGMQGTAKQTAAEELFKILSELAIYW